MDGGVVGYLHLEFELTCTVFGDRCAEDTTPIAHHEVHLLRGDLFGCDDEVTFVLAVFIVDDNEKFATAEVLEGFLYRIQLNFTHRFICVCSF